MAVSARSMRPRSRGLTSPRQIAGLAQWFDASATETLLPVADAVIDDIFSPLSIGSGPFMWLSAGYAGNTVANGRVTSLVDIMSSFSNANPPLTAAGHGATVTSPLLIAGAIGGLPAMRFNGTTDGLVSSGVTAIENAPPAKCLVAVVRINSSSATVQTVIAVEDYGANASYISVAPNSSSSLGVSNDSGLAFRADSPKPVIVVSTYAGATGVRNVYHNGRLVATGTDSVPMDDPPYWVSLGRNGPDVYPESGYPASCDIAEVVIYGDEFSIGDVNKLTLYYSKKYGIVTDVSPASMTTTAVNAPTEIAGLTEWFDATDTSGTVTTVDENKISSWASKVAGGRTLTQGNDTLRPVMTDKIQNGLRMAKFDGVNDFIRTATPETFADKTVFIVARPTDVSATQAVWGASKQNIVLYGYYYSAGFRINSAAVTVRPETAGAVARRIAASANEAIITSLQFKTSEVVAGNFSSIAPYKNGTLFDTNDSVVLSDYAIGSTMGANDARPAAGVLSNFYSGYVGEVLIYDAYLSAVDRARVEKYLQKKWLTPTVPDPTVPPVAAWLDKSGNQRHLTQVTTTAGYRPTFEPASANFNSKNTLLFGYASGSMVSSATIANIVKNPTTAPEITVICAGYSPSPGNGGAWAIGSDVQTNGRLFFVVGYGSEGNMIWDTVNANEAATGGRLTNILGTSMAYRPHTLAFYRHTSAMGLRLDGGVMAARNNAGSNYSVTSAKLQVGKMDGFPTNAMLYLSEMLVYAGAVSDANIQQLEAYLSKKWSMSNAYNGGPKVSNVDAQDWIRRVYVSGGTVSSFTAQAVNDFCNAIDAANIRNKFYRLNFHCGGTSGTAAGVAACLVPLYRGQSRLGLQYGNGIDINNGPFSPADYAETGASGGLLCNGSNKYLALGTMAELKPSWTTHHFGLDIKNGYPDATGRYQMGAYFNEGRTDAKGWYSLNGSTSFKGFDSGSTSRYGITASANMKIAVRSTSTDLRLYEDGVQVSTTQAVADSATVLPGGQFCIGAASYQNANNTIINGYAPAVGIMRGYSIGETMDTTAREAFSAAWSAFRTTMGRT